VRYVQPGGTTTGGQEWQNLLLTADVVIFGGCDDESYIRERLAAGKPIFRYNERLYKEGQWKAISPRGLLQKYKDHTRYRKAPVYFLCAGAYVPCDLGIIHAYPEKMLRFGYFPETREYAPGEPFSRKKKGSILWAARMIDWKHPELAENIGECTEMQTYEELTPFMVMIRKQHEDIMKNARMRQEFSANVSHELKTPLTSISGYAELIETGMASEQDTVRFAHGIHNSANRLLTLINDIIRLSELDGTEGEADTELLDLHEMAQNCVEMLSMSAEKHNVTIALSGTECYVTANRQMMEELLYNLCDNAIRYNNPGGSVDVQTYAREDHTYLIVKDTGIGISKEHQERIFERFYRVDKSRSKSTGGTGLGLAIVKHIIAKSHANLELESEPGKGTTIKVVF
jgi:signal transduction histidine kinase